MQRKSLWIKLSFKCKNEMNGKSCTVHEQLLTETQLSTFTEITVLTGIHVSCHLLNSLYKKNKGEY